MKVWSGSHKANLKDHDQLFDEGNLLTRGQTINNVPKDKIKPPNSEILILTIKPCCNPVNIRSGA